MKKSHGHVASPLTRPASRPKKAKSPREDFFTGADKNCRYEHFKWGDGKIDLKMLCTHENATQTMELAGTYQPNAYKMAMSVASKGSNPAEVMNMKMNVDAQRVGGATRARASPERERVAQSDYRRGRGHFGVCLFSRSAGSEGRDSDVACGGQYEASWKVASLQSVDKTTPATNLKQDASGTTLACIAADGTIDPALFAEDGDSCSANNPYVRTAASASTSPASARAQAARSDSR